MTITMTTGIDRMTAARTSLTAALAANPLDMNLRAALEHLDALAAETTTVSLMDPITGWPTILPSPASVVLANPESGPRITVRMPNGAGVEMSRTYGSGGPGDAHDHMVPHDAYAWLEYFDVLPEHDSKSVTWSDLGSALTRALDLWQGLKAASEQ